MKIGIDARLWSQTGVGRYIRSLFQYLPLLDHENEYIWFLRKKEFDSIELPSNKWKKVLADVHWHSLKEQIFLPWIFINEGLDLLHFPYFSFPILYPGKYVITIHDLIFDHYKTGKTSTLPPIFYLIKKIGYHLVIWTSTRRAQKIITLSLDAKKEIIDHYGTDADKIAVTYESGALENKSTGTHTGLDRIRKLQPYILYVGNAHPHKNVESLIKAIKLIQQSEKNLRLVLIGYDKFFYPRLQATIKKEKLEHRVQIIGEIPNSELLNWYQQAECFVSASKMEGFGIPPLEAMSVGTPVVVSDIPIFHEIYKDAARYFNNSDPQDIARVITQTLENIMLKKRLIENGYQRANLYSWKKMTAETIKIYKHILTL